MSSAGKPIEQARVEVAGGGAHTFTNARGAFRLDGAEPPVLLLVTHPRFEDAAVELKAETAVPLDIALVAKQQVFEQIVVSANRGGDGFAPVSVASTVVEPLRDGATPGNLAEVVAGVPGVTHNGQGGQFQVFSRPTSCA